MTRTRVIIAVLALAAVVAGCERPRPVESSSPTTSPSASAPAYPTATRTGLPRLRVDARPLWTTAKLRRGTAAEFVVHGTLAAVTFGSGDIAVVRAATGRVVWSVRESDDRLRGGGDLQLSQYEIGRSPVVDSAAGPLVLVGYYRDTRDVHETGIAALGLRTGAVRWTSPVGDRDGDDYDYRLVHASADGVVVARTVVDGADDRIPAAGAQTVVLDPATGRVRWRAVGAVADLVAGDTVIGLHGVRGYLPEYLGSPQGDLTGYDLRTGRQLWRRSGLESRYLPDNATDTTFVLAIGDTILDARSGRTLVREKTVNCQSDDAVLACLDNDDRLLTLTSSDPSLRQAGHAVRPGRYDSYDVELVHAGRIFLSELGHDGTFAVDRAGKTVVAPLTGRAHQVAGRYLVTGSGDRYDDDQIFAVYRLAR